MVWNYTTKKQCDNQTIRYLFFHLHVELLKEVTGCENLSALGSKGQNVHRLKLSLEENHILTLPDYQRCGRHLASQQRESESQFWKCVLCFAEISLCVRGLEPKKKKNSTKKSLILQGTKTNYVQMYSTYSTHSQACVLLFIICTLPHMFCKIGFPGGGHGRWT